MNKPTNFPKNAKCVYKGQNFDIWKWPQKMFDGSIKIFERAVQIGGVSVFAGAGDKVILLKQRQPGTPWYFGVPGGAMDIKGEAPRKTAARELLEETGYKAGSLKLWRVLKKPGRMWHTRYIFIAKNCQKVADQSLDNGEIIQVRLKTFEQLLKISDDPQFHEGDIYHELLKARIDPKYRKSLKQALFGKSTKKSVKNSRSQ